MSTVAYRAALIREIKQAMKRVDISLVTNDAYYEGLVAGKLDAYAHILSLVDDLEDL
jgi:hypothetical protein